MKNQELIKRKKEAKKLQDLIIEKLRTVQMLVIEHILNGDNVHFNMSNVVKGAYIRFENDENIDDTNYYIRVNHFDHQSHDNNSICEFYQEQLDKLEYWISIL